MKKVCPNCKGCREVGNDDGAIVWCTWCNGTGYIEVTVGGYPVKED